MIRKPGRSSTVSNAIDELADHARPFAGAFAEKLTSEELLSRIEGEPDGPEWRQRYDRFIERFGHRAPREFDLFAPRWREAPRMVLDLIHASLLSSQSERVVDRLLRQAEKRRKTIAAAAAVAPRWRRPLMRFTMRLVERYMPLREAPKHYGLVVFFRIRQAILELGRRLASRGLIHESEDVFSPTAKRPRSSRSARRAWRSCTRSCVRGAGATSDNKRGRCLHSSARTACRSMSRSRG